MYTTRRIHSGKDGQRVGVCVCNIFSVRYNNKIRARRRKTTLKRSGLNIIAGNMKLYDEQEDVICLLINATFIILFILYMHGIFLKIFTFPRLRMPSAIYINKVGAPNTKIIHFSFSRAANFMINSILFCNIYI